MTKSYKKILITVSVSIVIVFVGYFIVRAGFDYVGDDFTDISKVGLGTERLEFDTTGGQVKIPDCYSVDGTWGDAIATTVRDVNSLSASNTVEKDIYCDNSNCVFYQKGEGPPSNTLCVGTDDNVYQNLLWAKSDDGSSISWGPGSSITGGDVGGTHEANLYVGIDNNNNVGGDNWLAQYYESSHGTYNAMDVCKNKGNGWRLPNILELDGIRDNDADDSSELPGITPVGYWSSSEHSSSNAWYLSFCSGVVDDIAKSHFISRMRCVRGW